MIGYLQFTFFMLGAVTFVELFNEHILPAIMIAVAGIIVTLGVRADELIKTKLGIDTRGAIASMVRTFVAEADALIVDGLREASADGKITAEEAKHVAATVRDRVFQQFGLSGLDSIAKKLRTTADAAKKFVEAEIEAAVDERKRETIASLAAALNAEPSPSASTTAGEPPRSLSLDGPSRPSQR